MALQGTNSKRLIVSQIVCESLEGEMNVPSAVAAARPTFEGFEGNMNTLSEPIKEFVVRVVTTTAIELLT